MLCMTLEEFAGYVEMLELEEFAGYVERLEQTAKFTKLQMTMMSIAASSTTALLVGEKKSKERNKDNETPGVHKCMYCKKMVTHDDDFWEKPGNPVGSRVFTLLRNILSPVAALTRTRNPLPFSLQTSSIDHR